MARGWESKSIEAQQEEAKEKSRRPEGKVLSPQQAARKRELEGLMLSRQRINEQLSAMQDPRRRAMLEQALRDLEAKINATKNEADAG
jgi:hypothetical protein